MNFLNIKNEDIILFGHSLGSAASIHLATIMCFKKIKGIILLNPISSALRLMSHDSNVDKKNEICDVFNNFNKINDVECPIFLIHGQLDDLIPYEQSIEMAKNIKKLYEWYPTHGDHNNILVKYRSKFIQKTNLFLEHLYIQATKFKRKSFNSFRGHVTKGILRESSQNFQGNNDKNSFENNGYSKSNEQTFSIISSNREIISNDYIYNENYMDKSDFYKKEKIRRSNSNYYTSEQESASTSHEFQLDCLEKTPLNLKKDNLYKIVTNKNLPFTTLTKKIDKINKKGKNHNIQHEKDKAIVRKFAKSKTTRIIMCDNNYNDLDDFVLNKKAYDNNNNYNNNNNNLSSSHSGNFSKVSIVHHKDNKELEEQYKNAINNSKYGF